MKTVKSIAPQTMIQVTLTRTQIHTIMGHLEHSPTGYKSKDLFRLNRIYGSFDPIESAYTDEATKLDNDANAIKKFLFEYGAVEHEIEFHPKDHDLIATSIKGMEAIRGNQEIVRELYAIRQAFGIIDEE